MKVSIVAQTLSATVGLEIKRKGHEEFGNYILMMDRWFDMMNTSYYHSQRRGKPDMKPFEANDCFSNKRLICLKNIFIPYLKHGISVFLKLPKQNVEPCFLAKQLQMVC